MQAFHCTLDTNNGDAGVTIRVADPNPVFEINTDSSPYPNTALFDLRVKNRHPVRSSFLKFCLLTRFYKNSTLKGIRYNCDN